MSASTTTTQTASATPEVVAKASRKARVVSMFYFVEHQDVDGTLRMRRVFLKQATK